MTLKTIDADLAIIGGGGSGLAAAVRAKEAGVKDVVVLEKSTRPGGNAWLAVVMLGLGDQVQPEGDLTAWRDQSFGSLMQFGQWTGDPKVVGNYLDTYPEVVRWLVAKGMHFDKGGFDVAGRHFSTLCMLERKGDYKVTEPSRGPGFVGSTVVDLLVRDCLKLGVRVMPKTKATKILLNAAETEVRGVQASGFDGDFTVNAPSVVLAAGGFGANKEMMRQYFPEHFREEGPIETLCLGSSTGDGLVMAQEIGLQMGEDMDPGIIGPGHHPWSHSLHEAVHRPETLWVNKKGERFINESMSMMAGRALMRQPGTIIWALFDSRAKEHMQATPSPRQVQMGGEGWLRTLGEDLEKEEGWTRKTAAIAGSLDELARKIEVNPEALRATVDRYNELCDQGRDADFVKPASLLMPLRTPPYRAVLGVRFCHGTSGGVRVNGRMEVSGRGGQRIEGLYATGDNTSGWVTEWGPPGTTLGFAFTSGYIAGEQAAAHLSRQRSMSTQTPR